MTIYFHRQIDKIKKSVLGLSAMVEQSLVQAIEAVQKRDVEIAQAVIDRDVQIDITEVDVEEEVLSALALHQPVATDLRFLVGVLKMNHDLERIGDLAVNIAQQAIVLSGRPPIQDIDFGLGKMSELAQVMLKQSLDSLVTLDGDLATHVRKLDDQVDDLHAKMYDIVEDAIKKDVEQVDSYIRLMICGRQLERIADHATNIAKDVLYLVKGDIVRHASKRGLKID
ncbi:MAG: phosphate signaling complex protein PhoU [Phycisphaeraceae bacterium]|nr:phosphate signaling complex protein PhoU [Phycisphaeraceae bacterium]